MTESHVNTCSTAFDRATTLLKEIKASKRQAGRSTKYRYNPLIIKAKKMQVILYDRYEKAVMDYIAAILDS